MKIVIVGITIKVYARGNTSAVLYNTSKYVIYV
jgi:hypothetical protein